jgi:hypothetical protein
MIGSPGERLGRTAVSKLPGGQPKETMVLWKGGETSSGAGAVASHTGTLAGEDRVWENGFAGGITLRLFLEEVVGRHGFLISSSPQGLASFILGGGGGKQRYMHICMRVGLQVLFLAGDTDKISGMVLGRFFGPQSRRCLEGVL